MESLLRIRQQLAGRNIWGNKISLLQRRESDDCDNIDCRPSLSWGRNDMLYVLGGETPGASSNMDSKRGIPVPELQSQASIRRRKMGAH